MVGRGHGRRDDGLGRLSRQLRDGPPDQRREGAEDGVHVFFAGAQRDADGVLRTAGGRVLCVVASGASLAEARERAYDRVRGISFEGAHYRTDIGARASEPARSSA